MSIDRREIKLINIPRDSLESPDYFIVHYKLLPRHDLTVQEAATYIALVSSVGTLSQLPYEQTETRLALAGKVLAAERDGEVIIAYPMALCAAAEGITQFLSMLIFPASYNYAKELWIERIEFPVRFLERFQGPRFGVDGLRERFDVRSRPFIGMILKPRLGVPLATIVKQVVDVLASGADFVVDDELILDPDGELGFKRRVSAIMDAVRRCEDRTRERKWYVVNVSASPLRARSYAETAIQYGAEGIVVNAFTMGFGTVSELIDELGGRIPITVHNMGVGILTRPLESGVSRPTGISDAIMSKLSRLIGGDAIHAGVSAADWYHNDAWGAPIAEVRYRLRHLRPSMPVAAGGVNIANIWDNISSLGPDVILEAGSGLLAYPGGAGRGAAAFRKVVDVVDPDMKESEAKELIVELAEHDKSVRSGLEQHGFFERLGRG